MRNGKFRIPLIYVVIGLLWVTFSNIGILSITDKTSSELIRFLIFGKGFIFILTTGFLLYLLIAREQRKSDRSERQYRDIYEGNPNPIWFYDPLTFKFVSVNDSAIANYGYSRKEFLSMTIMDIRPPEDAEKVKLSSNPMVADLRESGGWRHLKKDGTLLYVTISSHKTRLDNMDVVMVMARDTTEKFLYEKQLQQVNAELTEQKAQLDKNYVRQEHILNSITESFFTLDKNHFITNANENFYLVTGLDISAVGRRWEEIFPESKDSLLYYQVDNAINSKKTVKLQIFSKILHKWLALSVYPEAEETTIYFSDITFEKEKDIQLKLALERYDIASRATGEVIYDLDLASNVLVFSKEISTLAQVLPSEIKESLEWWRSLVHPDDLKQLVISQDGGINSNEKYWNAEYRIKVGIDKYKYVYDQCHLILDADQQPIRAIGALRDIDLLKRSVDQLKTMGDILSKISSAVIISNPKGKITWVNPAFTELTGYSELETLGKDHTNFLYATGTDELRVDQINTAIVKKEAFSGELLNYAKSNKEYWVTLSLSPIFDSQGELECYISVENDITERKDKDAELERQNEKLKAVSWLNSHQLRKPVASIMALSELMKISDNEEEKHELFNILCECTVELDQIIHQINAEASGKVIP